MNKFINHLKKYPLRYLVILLFSLSLSYGIANLSKLVKEEEKISIFVGTYTTDITEFEKQAKQSSPSYIKEVSIYSYLIDDSNFESYYSTVAINKCDIVIIPASIIDKQTVLETYKKIPDKIENEYFLNQSFYSIYEKNYGLMVHKKGESDSGLLTYTKQGVEDQNYYAFFSSSSIHVSNRYNTVYKIMKGLLDAI